MAKTNISFKGRTYAIDKQALTDTASELKNHLLNTMGGEGATIALDGTTYNVDSEKLLEEHSDLFNHVSTNINASSTDDTAGYVNLGGIAYPISTAKVNKVFTELNKTFSTLTGFVPGLYQTGAAALYREQGHEAIKDMLITSWDDLLADGTVGFSALGIHTNFAMNPNTFIFSNASAAALCGDLILPTDGSVTALGTNAFRALPGLTAVVLPEGVTSFNILCFMDCTNLTELVLPATLKSLGGTDTFQNCISLRNIYFTGTWQQWITIEGSGMHADDLTNCTIHYNYVLHDMAPVASNFALRRPSAETYNTTSYEEQTGSSPAITYVAHDGVTTIGSYAFAGCQEPTKIVIPDGITTIGGGAFAYCPNLTEVILPSTVTSLGAYVFMHCDNITNVAFNGTVEQFNSVLKEDSFLDSLVTYVQCIDGRVAVKN